MILVQNLVKTFPGAGGAGEVSALRGIDLEIPDGEIFGIVGPSGSGKSTLLRCLNLLEKPTSGRIVFGKDDLSTLSGSQLRAARRRIGTVFQQFNLLHSRTVLGNIVFPLEVAGVGRSAREARAKELVDLVGLAGKEKSYPSQLSGGQQQRVGIARALASEPELLLCDEATSALDPQTTRDILQLLKELNRKLGITIVLITHEMAVVKEVCNRVAVMENGEIVERGDIYSVFSNPQKPITRRFIDTTDGVEQIKLQLSENPGALNLRSGDSVVMFAFHGESTGHALISRLSREFDIDISIIYGNVEMLAGKPLGKLVTVIRGDHESVQGALKKIEGSDVRSEVLYHV